MFFIPVSIFAETGNPIINQTLKNLKGAHFFTIVKLSKMNFSLDTTVLKASPYIKFISKKDDTYKSSKYKFKFYEAINSNKNFDLTLMDGNNWHSLVKFKGDSISKLLSFSFNDDENNSYSNFKSNFPFYSILFFPDKYFNFFINWKLISEEKIENEDTWLFEYNFKHDLGYDVSYKINICKSDTFLRRFSIICSNYEKRPELIEVYLRLDITSHTSLGENCDSIFDINKQIQKFNKGKSELNESNIDKKTINRIKLDTAEILLNSIMIKMNGDSTKLSIFKDRWILVDFWYIGCFPCYKAMDFFNKMAVKYKENGLIVYGINPIDNDRKALSRLFNEKGLTYQYLIDPKGNCKKLLGISGFPTLFLISPDNKLVWQHFGYTTSMDAELEKILEKNILNK